MSFKEALQISMHNNLDLHDEISELKITMQHQGNVIKEQRRENVELAEQLDTKTKIVKELIQEKVLGRAQMMKEGGNEEEYDSKTHSKSLFKALECHFNDVEAQNQILKDTMLQAKLENEDLRNRIQSQDDTIDILRHNIRAQDRDNYHLKKQIIQQQRRVHDLESKENELCWLRWDHKRLKTRLKNIDS